jgi:hypothetical protein
MLRKALCTVVVALCFVAPLLVQAQEQYLDVTIVRVKPEKNADFAVLAKKIAAANRKNNGDQWLAQEVLYGEAYTYAFVSTRADYASIDKGNDAFVGALNKAYGKEAAEKMLHDLDNDLVWSRTELRKRRFDLSRKVPGSAADYAKLIGTSRVLRTTAVHVRPGHVADFEALLKDTKAAGESNPNTQPMLVSQVVEGTNGTVFYITGLRSSLGGFDNNPTTKEILGEEGYKKFLQANADNVEKTESMILRFSPELSNPPETIMAAAPDYWQPKAAVATKPKAKGVQPASQKQPTQ